MLTLTLGVLLAATPTVKLAAPGLSYGNMDEKTGGAFLDYFAQQLAGNGRIQVTTATEISSVLGFERGRQLMACSDAASSCLTELAGALGVDGLITGSLAKVGRGYLVNIKVVSVRDAHALGIYSAHPRDEEALVEYLAASAKALSRVLAPDAATVFAPPGSALPPPSPAEPLAVIAAPNPSTPGSPRRAWIGSAVAAGGLLAAGGISLGLAHGVEGRLGSGDPTIQTAAQLESVRSTGEGEQALGLALGGVALSAVAVSGGLYAWADHGRNARDAWWMPLAAGGACAVTSGILYGITKADESGLRSGSPTSLDEAQRLRSAGSMAQTASFVMAGGALLWAGSALGLRFLDPDGDARATVVMGSSSVGVAGRF